MLHKIIYTVNNKHIFAIFITKKVITVNVERQKRRHSSGQILGKNGFRNNN